MDPLNISAKFDVHSWDNRRYFKNLGSPLIRPRSLFSQIFKGLLFAWTLWIHPPNLNFVALIVPEIIGGTQKIVPSLDTPTLPFLQNFSWSCVRMDPVNVSAKFAVRIALAVPEIIVIAVLECGCEPQSWGRGGRRGRGWYRSKECWWLPIGSPQ